MWIWLAISMLVVIACIIFGIYSFISSRTLHKLIAENRGFKSGDMPSQADVSNSAALPRQAVGKLKNKLKSIEENSLLSAHHLNELKKRIQILESTSLNLANDEAKWDYSGEDWEKLYYEIKREKQSLEDSLNDVKDALQENMDTLQQLEKHQAAMKSDVESGINEILSLQNIIEELQRKVEGGMERERELAHELSHEKSNYSGYELLQKENNQLHSQIDILGIRLTEMNDQNILMEEKIKSLTELGSTIAISGV